MGNENHYTPRKTSTGKLILVRHAESEWNKLGKWTGLTDVHLTDKGQQDATLLGEALKDIDIDVVYCSEQVRTLETAQTILRVAKKDKVEIKRSKLLNERDYGEYTGLNKWEVLDKLGDDIFHQIRRSWDYPIPGGETLKMVFARSVPFYKQYIVPQLHDGKTILITSHGNTLRSLIKYLEKISDEGIGHVEMPFDNIYIYTVSEEGHAVEKEKRTIQIEKSHA
jgi:2,3-bisphosphoglycerate-dependent phosphoglycerate mutase